MNRWNVYSQMKNAWMGTQGEETLTVWDLLNMFPNINDNELQEGIVEFRLMASRCYKEYGFETDLSACKV